MTAEDALAAERQGLLEKAADLYEEALSQGTMPLWAWLNLIVLYWQVTDYGFWTARRLPLAFVKRAGNRLEEVISLAQTLFPKRTEVSFWSGYIHWVSLGTPFDARECECFLKDNPSDLTPAFFLFSQSNGSRYAPEAKRLLEIYKGKETLRAAYITSVVEARLRRLREFR